MENRLTPNRHPDTEGSYKLEEDQNKFRLADPGFAKFVKKPPKEHYDVPRQYLEGGTRTYGLCYSIKYPLRVLNQFDIGAPEYPGMSHKPVSQAIDIWSLGCVFSLAATWIILGHTGVMQYAAVRQLATRKHIQARQSQNPAPNKAEVTEIDEFHDGHEVLETVTHWHQYLRNSHRRTDTITPSVLDLVDERMLLGLGNKRINAHDLCSKLDSILKECPSNSEPQLPEKLVFLLGEVDMEASLAAASVRRSRHTAKASAAPSCKNPCHAERLLKTTHRQSFWPNQNMRVHDGKYPALPLQAIPEQLHPYDKAFQTPLETTNHHGKHSNSAVHSTPPRPRRPGAKKHPPQNYFQACEEIQKRESDRKFYNKVTNWAKDSKDGLLTSYFRGTRDIVSFNFMRTSEPVMILTNIRFSWLTMRKRWANIGLKRPNFSTCWWKRQEA